MRHLFAFLNPLDPSFPESIPSKLRNKRPLSPNVLAGATPTTRFGGHLFFQNGRENPVSPSFARDRASLERSLFFRDYSRLLITVIFALARARVLSKKTVTAVATLVRNGIHNQTQRDDAYGDDVREAWLRYSRAGKRLQAAYARACARLSSSAPRSRRPFMMFRRQTSSRLSPFVKIPFASREHSAEFSLLLFPLHHQVSLITVILVRVKLYSG